MHMSSSPPFRVGVLSQSTTDICVPHSVMLTYGTPKVGATTPALPVVFAVVKKVDVDPRRVEGEK